MKNVKLVEVKNELVKLEKDFKRLGLEEATRIEELVQKCDEPLQIMVMGAFSTGKSSFINAIMGEELAIVGALPTTAVVTKICFGEKEQVRVTYKDGGEEYFETNKFRELSSESGKEWKILHDKIDYITFLVNRDILHKINIIDSPGLDDISESHIKATKRFVNNADVVFWVFTAEGVLTAMEQESLDLLDGRLKPVAIVNKIDMIDEDDDGDIEDFLHDVRKKLKNKVSSVIGISALEALQGKTQNDSELIDDSNIIQVEKYINDEIIPKTEWFKFNNIVHLLSSIIYERNGKIESDGLFEPVVDVVSRYTEQGIKTGESSVYVFEATKCLLGISCNQDYDKAMKLYEFAAEKNNIFAMLVLACERYREEERWSDQAIFWMKKIEALYVDDVDLKSFKGPIFFGLGFMYGVEADENEDKRKAYEKKSFYYYQMSLNEGFEDAETLLAGCFLEGLGCDKNIDEAIRLFKRAAERGDVYAMRPLGDIYCGIFDPVYKDIETAIFWLKRAADGDGNDYDSIRTLGLLYLGRLDPAYKDIKLAITWLERAVEIKEGYDEEDEVEVELFSCYCGVFGGVEPDYDKAIKFANDNINAPGIKKWLGVVYGRIEEYDKAILVLEDVLSKDGRDQTVRIKLAEAYYSKENPNYKRAMEVLEPLADEDDYAQELCGLMYAKGGYGIGRNVDKGIYWLKRSAENGLADAAYALGMVYIDEEYGIQDRGQSVKWIEKAAEMGNEAAVEILNDIKEYEANVSKERASSNQGCLVWLILPPITFVSSLYYLLS